MNDTSTKGRLRSGDLVALVFGSICSIFGAALLIGGGTLVWAHSTQRDAGGFYNSPREALSTGSYALTASVDLDDFEGDAGWVLDQTLGTVRVRAVAPDGAPIFVGIAPTGAVDAWLDGVAHSHVDGSNFARPGGSSELVRGDRAPGRPGAQEFWVASASGPGRQAAVWPSDQGRWTAVVMNEDGSSEVAAEVTVGARTGVLLPVGIGLIAGGLLLSVAGTLLVFVGLREHAMGSIAFERPGRPGAYPARLDGHLDAAVGRWTWLIKWVLVIPHAIVLAFLWMNVTVLTVVAGVSILIRGRYPRPIFEFNLGVMRWSWRVAFYTTSAFGTDRYPPFTFHPDPAFPADYAVDYPEHLSRGLVLVKWWLLALPHLVVVGLLSGGWGIGAGGSWRIVAGGGLIAVLSLIAAVVLAVRGRYPVSLFELVMGLNRWCYRVLAYVALMTDEYPPFRLDLGGDDPGSLGPADDGGSSGSGDAERAGRVTDRLVPDSSLVAG